MGDGFVLENNILDLYTGQVYYIGDKPEEWLKEHREFQLVKQEFRGIAGNRMTYNYWVCEPFKVF